MLPSLDASCTTDCCVPLKGSMANRVALDVTRRAAGGSSQRIGDAQAGDVHSSAGSQELIWASGFTQTLIP